MGSGYVHGDIANELSWQQKRTWSHVVRDQQQALCEALERAHQSPRFRWDALGMDLSSLPMEDVNTLYRAYFMGHALHDDDDRAEIIAWGDQQTMHDARQHAEL